MQASQWHLVCILVGRICQSFELSGNWSVELRYGGRKLHYSARIDEGKVED